MTNRKNIPLEERCRQVLEIIRIYKKDHNAWPSEREILVLSGLKIDRKTGMARGISIPGFIDQTYSIPLKGIIAANNRNPAIVLDEDTTSTIEIPPNLMKGKNRSSIYALTVQGHSMEEAAICDGDTVLLLEGDTWNEGDIVAVWLNDENAMTLKMIHGGRAGVVKLQPKSHKHQTRVEYQGDIKVLGKLVGIMRTYN
jgi:repressor LexA